MSASLLHWQAEKGAEEPEGNAAGALPPGASPSAGHVSAAQATGAPAAASAAAREPSAEAASAAEPAAPRPSAREGGPVAGAPAARGSLWPAAAAPSARAGVPPAGGPGAGESGGPAAGGPAAGGPLTAGASAAERGALRPDVAEFLARGGFDSGSALYRAAVRIQASYRGYAVRKARASAQAILSPCLQAHTSIYTQVLGRVLLLSALPIHLSFGLNTSVCRCASWQAYTATGILAQCSISSRVC